MRLRQLHCLHCRRTQRLTRSTTRTKFCLAGMRSLRIPPVHSELDNRIWSTTRAAYSQEFVICSCRQRATSRCISGRSEVPTHHARYQIATQVRRVLFGTVPSTMILFCGSAHSRRSACRCACGIVCRRREGNANRSLHAASGPSTTDPTQGRDD